MKGYNFQDNTERKIQKELFIVFVIFIVSTVIRFLIADRYPIKLECYSDEIRYYNIASSIANGNGITLYNGFTDYQKILYSICIAPAFLFNSLEIRFSAIFFINSVMMSAGVFAIYYLSCKFIKTKVLRYSVFFMYLILAHMTYTMTFMSENLWIPLSLLLLCLFYRLLVEPFNNKMYMYFFNSVLGGVTYLAYLAKEIALVFPISYAIYILIKYIYDGNEAKDNKADKVKGYLVYIISFAIPYIILKITVFSGLGNSYSQMDIMALFGEGKFFYLLYGFLFFIAGFMVMTLILPVLLPVVYYDKLEPHTQKIILFLSLLLLSAAFVVSYTITLREDYPSLTPRLHMRYVAWMSIPFLVMFINLLERDIHEENLTQNLRWALVCIVAVFIVTVFQGLNVSAYDNTMWFVENMNRTTLFFMMLVLAILSIISFLFIKKRKKIVLIIFMLIMSIVQIYDNVYAIHVFSTAYSITEEEEQEAMILYHFVDSHEEENILYVEEWLTRECKIIDTYLAKKNIITTTGKKLCEQNNNEELVIGNINIPMAWYGDYVKQDIDYIIINNNYKVIESANCIKLNEACTKNYNTYQIIDSTEAISIYEAYIENGGKIIFEGDLWNADGYVDSGISINENYFTWTNGNEVKFKKIKLQKDKGEKTYLMTIQIKDIYADSQFIQIISNGELVYDEILNGETTLNIPVITDLDGYLNFSIMLPNAISPMEYEGSADVRKLALALDSITFTLIE